MNSHDHTSAQAPALIAGQSNVRIARTIFSGPFYIDSRGDKVYFRQVAERIRHERPDLQGKHIFAQLDALGLREAFDGGASPCALPFSFSDL